MTTVIKSTGEKEEFSENKLRASIKRAGIPDSEQEAVVLHIKSKLHENISTKEIYHHIKEFLGKSAHPYAQAKYSLKEAIMTLGPTGYPFEDFFARILQMKGFTTKTRQILSGTCITHEIDVVAQKHTVVANKIMVEAKFHNQVGLRTDVHVALYTKARFEDIKTKNGFTEVWLVTNTKASIDAIAYANCVRMNLISWSYPEGGSLRDLVEEFKMYPITVLSTLSAEQKQKLLERGIVLCSDVCKKPEIFKEFGIPKTAFDESQFVCSLQ